MPALKLEKAGFEAKLCQFVADTLSQLPILFKLRLSYLFKKKKKRDDVQRRRKIRKRKKRKEEKNEEDKKEKEEEEEKQWMKDDNYVFGIVFGK